MKRTNDKKEVRAICEIAMEIKKDWGSKLSPYAKPYLDAMMCLNKTTDHYGFDSGDLIVRYFLGNASTWRGEVAKRIKAELKSMLK